MTSNPIPLYRLFSGGNRVRNIRCARYLKILMFELFLCLEKVNTEPLNFFLIISKPLILSRLSQTELSFVLTMTKLERVF